MAVAVAIVDQTVFGNHRVTIADITFDSSYPTGGEPISPAALGLNKVLFCHTSTKSGYIVAYDYANDKLMVQTPTNAAAEAPIVAAAAAEVANATNLSTLVVRGMFVGN